jgi:hypothetical protein
MTRILASWTSSSLKNRLVGRAGRGPAGDAGKEVILCPGFSSPTPIAIAGRILDRFKAHFGQDNVFMDVDGNNQSYKETDCEEGNYPRRTV